MYVVCMCVLCMYVCVYVRMYVCVCMYVRPYVCVYYVCIVYVLCMYCVCIMYIYRAVGREAQPPFLIVSDILWQAQTLHHRVLLHERDCRPKNERHKEVTMKRVPRTMELSEVKGNNRT